MHTIFVKKKKKKKVRNEIETKRKRNRTKRNEIKRNETKRNEIFPKRDAMKKKKIQYGMKTKRIYNILIIQI